MAAAATALQWPITLLGLAGLIVDNPWSLVMDRAVKCGELLASVLIQVRGCFSHSSLFLHGFGKYFIVF